MIFNQSLLLVPRCISLEFNESLLKGINIFQKVITFLSNNDLNLIYKGVLQ